MSWPTVPFEELYAAASRNGVTRPANVRGAGYKMINMGELFAHDRIGDVPMERVSLNGRELASMLVESGDLLFARQSLVLAGAGKCSIVIDASEPTTFESHIIRVRLNRSIAEPTFFHYYFKSPNSGIRAIVTQGVQAGIRASDLKQLKIRIPPIKTQRQISSRLAAYDDLIQSNRRRIRLLGDAARLLYREWFARLRFPGHEHARIVDGVPEGWQPVPIGRICTDTRDAVMPENVPPEVPYIGLEHMPRRSITLFDWGKADDVQSQKFRFAEGDILFGKIRPYFHKVGFTLTDGITSSDAVVIRSREPALFLFTLSLLSSDAFVALASKTVKEGSKMPRADWKFLKTQLVSVPPDQLLRAFNDALEPMIAQLKTLALQTIKLRQARDLLLPRLMSGELAV